MVSGRPNDCLTSCKQCGKELIVYAFADRSDLVCPSCDIENAPAQLSLLPRSLQPKAAPKKYRERSWADTELPKEEEIPAQLTLIPSAEPVKGRPKGSTAAAIKIKEAHRVYCEVCRRRFDPTREAWYAAKCSNCWPPGVAADWLEEWRRINYL